MASLNLKLLMGRLNDASRRSLEAAAGMSLSHSNYNVELEHWLLKLVESSRTDIELLLRFYGVNTANLSRDLLRVVDRLKTGNSRSPALAEDILNLVREAWLIASVDYKASSVRTGHLLCALLADDSLRVGHWRPQANSRRFPSSRCGANWSISPAIRARPLPPPNRLRPTEEPHLGPWRPARRRRRSISSRSISPRGRRAGEIDPVLGRDSEIRQVIDILTRRRQNNPILTGEAGVGKTAVVEGFALRIVQGDVPASLQNVSLRVLDLGLLQAGAGVKGEFENRLKSVIEEVKESPKPIILFIDEAHTMIGAGGQAGQGDAANLLKPALARGELRTIAATTWAEYKKYFERDAALARRFQVVKVEEPSEENAVLMMRGLVDTLEGHHKMRILNEAVVEAVRLSHRYISGRQLPDKSVSLLDTACARVALEPWLRAGGRRRLPADASSNWLSISGSWSAKRRPAQTTRIGSPTTHRRKKEAEELLKKLNGRWTEELRVGQSHSRNSRPARGSSAAAGRRRQANSTDASNGNRLPPTAAENKQQPWPNRPSPRAPAPLPLSPEQRAELQCGAGRVGRPVKATARRSSRWSKSASTRRPWPRSSRAGPASPSAEWFATRSRPCSNCGSGWRSGSSASRTPWKRSPSGFAPPGPI